MSNDFVLAEGCRPSIEADDITICMDERYALQVRQGLIFAEMVMLNPLLAERANSILASLGYRAYLRQMKRYGHVSPGQGFYV